MFGAAVWLAAACAGCGDAGPKHLVSVGVDALLPAGPQSIKVTAIVSSDQGHVVARLRKADRRWALSLYEVPRGGVGAGVDVARCFFIALPAAIKAYEVRPPLRRSAVDPDGSLLRRTPRSRCAALSDVEVVDGSTAR